MCSELKELHISEGFFAVIVILTQSPPPMSQIDTAALLSAVTSSFYLEYYL